MSEESNLATVGRKVAEIAEAVGCEPEAVTVEIAEEFGTRTLEGSKLPTEAGARATNGERAGDGGDEGSDEGSEDDGGESDPNGGSDEPMTWEIDGEDVRYNTLQRRVGSLEMPYPDDTSGDHLAAILRNANESGPSDGEQASAEGSTDDENDDDGESDPNGGSDEPMTWRVNGEDVRYNTLQSRVGDLNRSYPDDTSGDNLAAILRTTNGAKDAGGSDDSDPNEGSLTKESLISKGVDIEDVKGVMEYRQKNGVCQEPDCPYGANDDSDYCIRHPSEGSDEGSDDSGSPKADRDPSDLTELEQAEATRLIEDEGKTLEEAMKMV
jgi:hypothetical protein